MDFAHSQVQTLFRKLKETIAFKMLMSPVKQKRQILCLPGGAHAAPHRSVQGRLCFASRTVATLPLVRVQEPVGAHGIPILP